MRTVFVNFLIATVVPAILDANRWVETLGTLTGRCVLATMGWLMVGLVPLVAFDAGGGQSAIEIIRYITFRGLDRDAWYAASALAMLTGFLSAFAILFGLVLHSMGLISRDWSLAAWGSGIILGSLSIVLLATHPVAAVSMFGAMALPHVGWWLTLCYTAFALKLVDHWSSTT